MIKRIFLHVLMAVSMIIPSMELRGEDLKPWFYWYDRWQWVDGEDCEFSKIWTQSTKTVEEAVFCFLELGNEKNSQELRELLTRLIDRALHDTDFLANIAERLGIKAPDAKNVKEEEMWYIDIYEFLRKWFKGHLIVDVSNETAKLLRKIIDDLLIKATMYDDDDDIGEFKEDFKDPSWWESSGKPILWLQGIISYIRKDPSKHLNDLKLFIAGIKIRGKDLSEEKLKEIKDDKELRSLRLRDCPDPSKLKSVLEQVIEKPYFMRLSVRNQKNNPLKINTELMGLFVKLLKKPNFKYFTLSGCEIDESAQNTLVEAIGSSHIEYLTLCNCRLDLRKLSQLPNSLHTLDIGGNNTIEWGIPNAIKTWIENAGHIVALQIPDCFKEQTFKEQTCLADLADSILTRYKNGKNFFLISGPTGALEKPKFKWECTWAPPKDTPVHGGIWPDSKGITQPLWYTLTSLQFAVLAKSLGKNFETIVLKDKGDKENEEVLKFIVKNMESVETVVFLTPGDSIPIEEGFDKEFGKTIKNGLYDPYHYSHYFDSYEDSDSQPPPRDIIQDERLGSSLKLHPIDKPKYLRFDLLNAKSIVQSLQTNISKLEIKGIDLRKFPQRGQNAILTALEKCENLEEIELYDSGLPESFFTKLPSTIKKLVLQASSDIYLYRDRSDLPEFIKRTTALKVLSIPSDVVNSEPLAKSLVESNCINTIEELEINSIVSGKERYPLDLKRKIEKTKKELPLEFQKVLRKMIENFSQKFLCDRYSATYTQDGKILQATVKVIDSDFFTFLDFATVLKKPETIVLPSLENLIEKEAESLKRIYKCSEVDLEKKATESCKRKIKYLELHYRLHTIEG